MQDMHDDTDPTFVRQVTLLRYGAGNWISRLRSDRLNNLLAGASTQSNYPLPPNFPFGHFQVREEVRWLDEDGQNTVRHSYPAHLVFRGLPNVTNGRDWDPFTWQIYSGEVILGHVELDARLFFDPNPLLPWNTDFVLEAMTKSLSLGRQLRVSSRIEEHSFNENMRENVQIFEMRTFGNEPVRELGRRVVPRRPCSICHRWLPPTGPPQCLLHDPTS